MYVPFSQTEGNVLPYKKHPLKISQQKSLRGVF